MRLWSEDETREWIEREERRMRRLDTALKLVLGAVVAGLVLALWGL